MVEKYIKELKEKNDIKTMKNLVREYDKQIDFYKSNKILEGKISRYVFNLLLICISIFLLFFGRVSIFIKLLYSMPLFIASIIALILDLKVREDKFNNEKLLYKSAIYFFVLIFLMSFTIIYIFQIILFRNWKDIDYIKSIILLISFLIPIIIATVYDSPKRFLKEFANTNRKYRGVSPAMGGIITVGIVAFNIFKPYYLVLGLSYVLILWFTWATTYLIFKYKQYDLIEDLKKYINNLDENKS